MKHIYSSIRGTTDFHPSTSSKVREINNKAGRICSIFGYQEIILPILEEKGLFIRGVGEATDIVERQMFKIEDKDVVLRPEATAQVIRYYIQNSLQKQSNFHKFFYTGPMFRGERPQKGRMRQFHHIGAEAIGSNSFYLDAEMVMLALKILGDVGVSEKELEINTLGCVEDKSKFSAYIQKELQSSKEKLCDNCQKRIRINPLRVLDCKHSQCRGVLHSLRLTQEHICSRCREHFNSLLSLLDELGIQYVHNPFLVRGLDYYTNTVFEITSSSLGSQDAIGAGGRYNNLMKSLGGEDIPAIGFALGLERILLVLDEAVNEPKIDVFVAAGSDLLKIAFDIVRSLREKGISCDYDYCAKSLKGQLRFAQKKGARFVVIVGEDELRQGCVVLKDMQNRTQEQIKTEELTAVIESSCCK